jgi:hypothetical protein
MTTLPERGKGSRGVGRYREVLELILLRWLFRRGIPMLCSLETVADFLKLVELSKGLVVLPCIASLVEVYGIHDPWHMGNTTCG